MTLPSKGSTAFRSQGARCAAFPNVCGVPTRTLPQPAPPSARRAAASTGADCSTCPLGYDPVIHTASGLLFYNECLAKCQLGEGAELEPAAPKAAKRSNPTVVRATAEATTTTGATATAADAAALVAEGGAEDAQTGSGAEGGDGTSVLLQLLPEPDDGDTHATAHPVTAAVVGRFRKEGFMFVGRPGRGRRARPADVLNEDTR